MDDHTRNIALAYGALWHVESPDPRIHAARHALRDRLAKDERAQGIRLAQQAGCIITLREVAVVDAEIDLAPLGYLAGGVERALKIARKASQRPVPWSWDARA